MNVGLDPVGDRVRQALQDSAKTALAAISVAELGGVVTLMGEVSSEEVREAAAQIAGEQEGVIEVINDLKVRYDDRLPPLPEL